MSKEKRLPADLSALEAQLAALRPSEVKLDRDVVMYEAGYQAGLRTKALSVSAGMNCSDASNSKATNPQLALGARNVRDGHVSLAQPLAPGVSQGFALRVAFASLASAAIAASVAVLITRASLAPAQLPEESDQVASVSEGASDVVVTEPIEEERSEATGSSTPSRAIVPALIPWGYDASGP